MTSGRFLVHVLCERYKRKRKKRCQVTAPNVSECHTELNITEQSCAWPASAPRASRAQQGWVMSVVFDLNGKYLLPALGECAAAFLLSKAKGLGPRGNRSSFLEEEHPECSSQEIRAHSPWSSSWMGARGRLSPCDSLSTRTGTFRRCSCRKDHCQVFLSKRWGHPLFPLVPHSLRIFIFSFQRRTHGDWWRAR